MSVSEIKEHSLSAGLFAHELGVLDKCRGISRFAGNLFEYFTVLVFEPTVL